MIGTIGGAVAGPYGPLVSGICKLVASVLPLFGGKKGPSMSELIDKVIREALDDFKDEAVYENVLGSLKEMASQVSQLNGIASHNGGKLSPEGKTFLTANFGRVAADALGILQGQIEKRERIDNDEKKSKRIAKYIYYYCMLSVQKHVVLNLQCSLLRINEMEGVFAGVANYLNNDLPKEDKKVLDFLSDLPSEEDKWWMVYRCVHTDLEPAQRYLITAYRKKIGCQPMKGELCAISNDKQEEYLYLSSNTFDDKRRNVFTWGPGDTDPRGLFRIIGEHDNCQIFGVYYGEYIYAADYEPFDQKRRRVFSWRPGRSVAQGDWKIDGSTIKNIYQDEYLYAADYGAHSSNERSVFTWRPGNMVSQGDWTIRPLSFEKDELKSQPSLK